MKQLNLTISILTICVLILAVMAAFGIPTDWWYTPDQQADRFFRMKDYDQAARLYTDSNRLGVASFRAGEFKRAASEFARVDNEISAFNRGNALLMSGSYNDAIASYDRALQFRPDWPEAQKNRQLAIARRDQLEPPEDNIGGTEDLLGADDIVFDDRAQKAEHPLEIEVGEGDALSDEQLNDLWLRRVQTKPGDFLRSKFAYQLSQQKLNQSGSLTEDENP